VAGRRQGTARRRPRHGNRCRRRGIVSPAATDDNGRPIVAELGRAETPAETAERKAKASAKRRSNQTAINLVIALVASLGLVLLVVLVVVRPEVPADQNLAV